MKLLKYIFFTAAILMSSLALYAGETVKYVFLFIGDGMSIPQRMTAEEFSRINTGKGLAMNSMPHQALTITRSKNSFITDSAACGVKTNNGAIGVGADGSRLQSIAEVARDSGRKVGILTSVTLNHATPASFYGHNPNRGNYYELGLDMIASGFDFFGGGGIGKSDDKKSKAYKGDIYKLAEKAGYKVVRRDMESLRALKPGCGKVIATGSDGALEYYLDNPSSARISEFTKKAIELLDNDKGFFIMVEGGKIDWACHANDAATSIYDTIALSDAVQVALDFAAAHPGECLIIVTADHETGGMTIGFATTAYDTHFQYLQNQKTSFTAFDDVISELKENGATFEDAMAKVEELYGLTTKEGEALSLTATDVESLRKAWDVAMGTQEIDKAEASLLYGGYTPFSMAVSHIMNNKAGLSYTSYAHTGLQIPVYAYGVGAEKFSGLYDNTGIFTRTMDAMGLTPDAE